jgi:hypothetical protein
MTPTDSDTFALMCIKHMQLIITQFELTRKDLDDNPDIALDIAMVVETLVSINRRISERENNVGPEELKTGFTATGKTLTLINGGKE